VGALESSTDAQNRLANKWMASQVYLFCGLRQKFGLEFKESKHAEPIGKNPKLLWGNFWKQSTRRILPLCKFWFL
jgi:hypothetical protein